MEPSDLGKRKARVVQEEDEVEEEVEEEEMMLDEVPPDELLEEDEIAAEINEDLESAGEDEYDEEDASEYGVRGSKRKLKAKAKADKSKKRSSSRSKSKTRGSAKRSLKRGRAPINEEDEYEEQNDDNGNDNEEEEDEDAHFSKNDNTVFIDNLPSDDFEIKRMLKEVRKQIKLLEKAFFEEEDSEQEDALKQITNVAKHEEALAAFRENAHLKQFWCIPLSVNVTGFSFEQLAAK